MRPEERKAVAMRQLDPPRLALLCDKHYPKCCNYHEGFDDALALLVAATTPLHERHPLYAIEAAP